MANGRSCCCSGLPKGWWWLLTLIGLSLLYYFMLSATWNPIEKDIQTRTTQQLSANNAAWSHVEIERRGRDVLLTGTTATETKRDNAIKTALAVEGVRTVDNNIEIVPLKERALLASYHHKNGKLLIEGILASQDNLDQLLKILADSLGMDNIINNLTISDKYADEGGTLILSGFVLSDDERSKIGSILKIGSDSLKLQATNNLTLDTEALKAIAEAKRIAEEKAEAERLAREKAEAEKIAAEKEQAEKLANEKAEAEKIAAEKEQAEKLANEKAEAEKIAAEKEQAEKLANEKAEAEKIAAEKAEAERIAKMAMAKTQIDACQTKLNKTMQGKTILFETNKAEVKDSSFTLLKTIAAVINECIHKLPDAHIAVSGHTDSKGSDDYNLALSERRANSVKTYLISIGVSSTIISSKGYGESQPVASNDTPEGRSQNRRITFSVQ